jgi:hypothetical protein
MKIKWLSKLHCRSLTENGRVIWMLIQADEGVYFYFSPLRQLRTFKTHYTHFNYAYNLCDIVFRFSLHKAE